jgi:2-polyprenyl-3-methyl-5-hydroxy-6-metoxy-1,4-benzoquinol methylase
MVLGTSSGYARKLPRLSCGHLDLRTIMKSDESHIEHAGLKKFLRNSLSKLGLNLTYAVTPGIALFGINVFRDPRPGPVRFRSLYAVDHALKLSPKTVLDVGSGGGIHARQFASHGCDVLCIDYGTSVYAEQASNDSLKVINTDFNAYRPEEKFDLVWASHVLEHQRDVGTFLERLIACCADDGTICITVPDPHRYLWGGHLTLWTPGLLAYNVVLCGIDLSDAEFLRGSGEFSFFFKPRRIALPNNLTFDYGDLDKLARLLPQQWQENGDPWKVEYAR